MTQSTIVSSVPCQWYVARGYGQRSFAFGYDEGIKSFMLEPIRHRHVAREFPEVPEEVLEQMSQEIGIWIMDQEFGDTSNRCTAVVAATSYEHACQIYEQYAAQYGYNPYNGD